MYVLDNENTGEKHKVCMYLTIKILGKTQGMYVLDNKNTGKNVRPILWNH